MIKVTMVETPVVGTFGLGSCELKNFTLKTGLRS